MTIGLQEASKEKNRLYKNFLKLRSKEMEIKYKKYKNIYTTLVRQSKKDYYQRKLEESQSNSKQMWEVLKSVIKVGGKAKQYPKFFEDNGNTIKDSLAIVNQFNKYFVNVGHELSKKIHHHIDDEVSLEKLIDLNPQTMFLREVDEREVITAVNECANKTSKDLNDISMMVIKNVIDVIAKPITYICNISFSSGIFPDELKIAKVVPLFKGEDEHLFTNYRPVSILPQLSKVLERLFFKRLESFIAKHALLSENQFGFRNGKSTSNAIIETIEGITNALDDKLYAVGLFIDIKKAFDTVDHHILMKKMERMGVRGRAMDWINSYLSNRKQFVVIDNNRSENLDILCGVPQGSVLGPLLFILYINDIVKVSEKLKLVLFADDTNVFCSGKNIDEMLKELQDEMERIKRWFNINKLSLNLNKTKIMLFGKHKSNINVKLVIDGVNIERVKETKFLGVIIDEKISWKYHIRNVQLKISKNTGILYKAKQFLNRASLRIIYCSFILPHLSYCAEIWGNNYKSAIKPLINLQKKAVRIVTNSFYTEHTHPLFVELKLLKLEDVIKFQTASTVHKILNGGAVKSIQKLFSLEINNYNLRSGNNIKPIRIKTNRKKFCMAYTGAVVWNSISVELRKVSKINLFKLRYKKFILNSYL